MDLKTFPPVRAKVVHILTFLAKFKIIADQVKEKNIFMDLSWVKYSCLSEFMCMSIWVVSDSSVLLGRPLHFTHSHDLLDSRTLSCVQSSVKPEGDTHSFSPNKSLDFDTWILDLVVWKQ